MLSLVVQHIDALITTVGGIFACFYGFRSARATAPTQQRATKILRVCGPLVVLFGILRFFIDQPAAPTWQRHTTSDGFASAEFPATPKATEQTDTINGVSAHRTSLTCDVPFKDISLFLTFNPMPPNEPNVPDTERIAAIKAYFTQQGFSVVHESPVQLGAGSGFALDLQRDAGKIRMWTRIAYIAAECIVSSFHLPAHITMTPSSLTTLSPSASNEPGANHALQRTTSPPSVRVSREFVSALCAPPAPSRPSLSLGRSAWRDPMGHPEYMDDEQLAVFGFAVTPDNPTLAAHTIYPKLTVRCRCPRCNLWAGTVKGGKELVCEQCHKGGRPVKTTRQFNKARPSDRGRVSVVSDCPGELRALLKEPEFPA